MKRIQPMVQPKLLHSHNITLNLNSKSINQSEKNGNKKY